MKASQLIKVLDGAVAIYGDMEVFVLAGTRPLRATDPQVRSMLVHVGDEEKTTVFVIDGEEI